MAQGSVMLSTFDVRQYAAGQDELTLFTMLIPYYPHVTICADLADGIAHRLNLQRCPPVTLVEVVDLFIQHDSSPCSGAEETTRSENLRFSPKCFHPAAFGDRWCVGIHVYDVIDSLASVWRDVLLDHMQREPRPDLTAASDALEVIVTIEYHGRRFRTVVHKDATIGDLLKQTALAGVARVVDPTTRAAIAPIERCAAIFQCLELIVFESVATEASPREFLSARVPASDDDRRTPEGHSNHR